MLFPKVRAVPWMVEIAHATGPKDAANTKSTSSTGSPVTPIQNSRSDSR